LHLFTFRIINKS